MAHEGPRKRYRQVFPFGKSSRPSIIVAQNVPLPPPPHEAGKWVEDTTFDESRERRETSSYEMVDRHIAKQGWAPIDW